MATRPVDLNGLGLPAVDAVGNIEEMLKGLDVVAEDAQSVVQLAGLVRDGFAVGSRCTTPTSLRWR